MVGAVELWTIPQGTDRKYSVRTQAHENEENGL